jgi:hypothetical protein
MVKFTIASHGVRANISRAGATYAKGKAIPTGTGRWKLVLIRQIHLLAVPEHQDVAASPQPTVEDAFRGGPGAGSAHDAINFLGRNTKTARPVACAAARGRSLAELVGSRGD